jgi:hypothetical protein
LCDANRPLTHYPVTAYTHSEADGISGTWVAFSMMRTA